MPSFFSDPTAITVQWYAWGVAAALLITILITFWIYFDSQRRHFQASLWRAISLLAAVLVIPSAVLWLFPDLALGLGELLRWLAFLGIIATLVSVLVLLLYIARLGVKPMGYDPGEALEEEPLVVGDDTLTVEITGETAATDAPRPAKTARSASATQVVTESLDFSQTPEGATREVQPQPAARQPLAWLVVMKGKRAGKEFRLGALTDIGRDSRHNDISIDDPTMSRQHARVRLEDKGFVIYDLASEHGVVVNGEKHQRAVLRNGDRITLGQTIFGYMVVKDLPEVAKS
ncbi:MAG: FHA domain-containing protein [Caldilineales bacterium]|nr:FHA domain-containing protein [Caldilineales bacterium]